MTPNTWLGARALLTLAAAMLLPLTVYILITAASNYHEEQKAAEERTLATTRRIIDEVDNQLELSAATMRALATIRSIRSRNWPEAESRFREIAQLRTDWRGVSLMDRENGRELANYGQCATVSSPNTTITPETSIQNFDAVRYSDIGDGLGGDNQIRALLDVSGAAGERYLLVVCFDPYVVQKALLDLAPREGVSAVVDRRGMFIARTKGWPERLGTASTHYVRDAIAHAKSGLYHGVTWEGMENYTAFATSNRTGWSAHVAVSATTIDKARRGSRLATAFAALISTLMAGIIALGISRFGAIRRAAEQRSARAERLESVGRLTGGIAHDFNNMLAIVMGSLELAKRKIDRGDLDVTRFIDNAMDGAQRAAELTGRLLAFSRRQPLAPTMIDANAVIDRTAALMERTLPANITVFRALAPHLWQTFVDPGQLENALVNLIVNARDAMPDGGTITLGSENHRGREANASDQIAVTVSDTGVGMPPDVVARAFEPFYTTKAAGHGTGLGLSQIHGFAIQSGGDVLIDSTPGEGTRISILLPRQQEQAGPDPKVPDGARQPGLPSAKPDEVVLVVEDEDRLRQTTVEALISLGYRTVEAHDGESALACLKTGARIDLLFSDIVMPGMSGRRLADKAIQMRTDLAVLLTTGYEREPQAQDKFAVLPKPFSLSELAVKVRQTLDHIQLRQDQD